MGYTCFVSTQVKLRPDVPAWVLDYLRSIVEDPQGDHHAEVPSGADQWWVDLPGTSWFVPPFAVGSLQDATGTPGQWTFRLQAELHDEFSAYEMQLMGLLAASADDGPIGATWTDMGPEVDTYLARDGHLFVASLANVPVAADPGGFEPPPTMDCTHPGPDVLVQHGLPPAEAQAMAGRRPLDPAFARYLLVRSLPA